MTKFLSKFITFVYLWNEFDCFKNFKVTTVLDSDGCWTNKVIIEGTNDSAADDTEFIDFYKKILDK